MNEERPRRPWDLSQIEEREYFDLLGDGLLVVLPARRPGPGGAGGWSPPLGGAWVHVGGGGKVRGFTGKVEVGQGTRTALSMLLAEELGVRLDQVELVMGDTDLTPWDMGTFGSRSMPDAAPALRAVGATARQALLDLAQEKLGVSKDRLEDREGRVQVRGNGRSLTYGELIQGARKLIIADPKVALAPAKDWKLAGRPTIDPFAEEVVTGRRTYTSDLRRPGLLYGAFLHPPRYGSRMEQVDVSTISKERGVQVVQEKDFVGVVAPTPWQARSAISQIEATWTETPQPSEEEIEAYLRSHPLPGDHWDTDSGTEGDPERALSSAATRVSATYRSAYIAHVPLETRAAVAEWDGDRLTVWVGTQTPYRAREHLASGLGIDQDKVRVKVPYTGSGFGGKHVGELGLAAARLSRASGHPVRVTYTRSEEFQYGYLRPYTIIDLKAGADPQGHLTSWSFHNVNGGAASLRPPYRIPNLKIDNELSASPLPQGAYRAIGATANNFAREGAMDELARALDLDPLVFRERNLQDERLLAVLHLACETARWGQRKRTEGHGFGLAVGLEKGGRVATVSDLTIVPGRKVRVDRIVSVFEAGAIVNPDNLRSQVEGATVMALGGALFEAIHFREGVVLNRRLSEYRVPRFSDLPSLEVVLLDRPDLPPAGAGETPMIAVAPSIANAIFDACGVRLRSLPLVPDGRVPPATT